jgi:hypothetical protein
MEKYEKKYGELKENSVVHILMAGVRSDCIGRGEFFEEIFGARGKSVLINTFK